MMELTAMGNSVKAFITTPNNPKGGSHVADAVFIDGWFYVCGVFHAGAE